MRVQYRSLSFLMRRFIDGAEHIYLACGAIDFRKQIPEFSMLID